MADYANHWQAEAAITRWRLYGVGMGGLEAIVDGALQRWFHPAFHVQEAQTVAHWRARVLDCDAAAYIACCQAIAGVDTTARLPGIAVPALVIAGALDQGRPPEMARVIAQGISGARLVVLPEASHLSVLEQPLDSRRVVDDWLQQALPA